MRRYNQYNNYGVIVMGNVQTQNIYNGDQPETAKEPEVNQDEYVDFEEVKEDEEKGADSDEQPSRRLDEKPTKPLPEVLTTELACELHEALMKDGLVDEQWQPLGLTRTKKALLAHAIAETLDIPNMWQVFEPLWGMNCMKSAYGKALNEACCVSFRKRLNDIIINK